MNIPTTEEEQKALCNSLIAGLTKENLEEAFKILSQLPVPIVVCGLKEGYKNDGLRKVFIESKPYADWFCNFGNKFFKDEYEKEFGVAS